MRVALLITGFTSFFIMPHMFLLPLYVKEQLIEGPHVLGTLWGVSAVGSLIATFLTARRTRTIGHLSTKHLVVGTLSSALGLIGLSLVPYLPFQYFFIFITGLSVVTVTVGSQTIIQSTVDPQYQGRVLGLWGTLFQGMFPLGNLAVGSLAQVTSLPTAWCISSVILILGLICLRNSIR